MTSVLGSVGALEWTLQHDKQALGIIVGGNHAVVGREPNSTALRVHLSHARSDLV